MKKYIQYMILAVAAAVVSAGCGLKMPDGPVALAEVRVNVMFDGERFPENATVTLRAQHHSASYSDVSRGGFADFAVPVGQYNVYVSYREDTGESQMSYNGSASSVFSSETGNVLDVDLVASRVSRLVVKELYVGGCQNDNGSGSFQNDKYVILYNNSDTEYDASNISLAMAYPYNSNSTNLYLSGGTLSYAAEGWIPATCSIWWFDTDVVIPPYSQIVVAIYSAVDHTATYSNSVNLGRSEYYAMYDLDDFSNTNYYSAPSENIPSSHYLQTYNYAVSNAWPISQHSPAFYIIERQDIESFVTDPSNYDYRDGNTRPNVKIPEDWIVDAVEVFLMNNTANNKRFTATIDAGYIYHRNDLGYSIYRNVDRVATEALAENDGLLVYDYSGGTTDIEPTYGTTDPSGIDAEASIANGAHIIYQDTNNSSNDFHLRAEASLRYRAE